MLKKSSVALAASLSVLLVAASPAAASAPVYTPATETVIEFQMDPRFDHMSRISSSLSVGDFGRANCTGSFTTYDEYDSTITITLQQFIDSKWTDIKEWSEDFTGSGVKYINKGYYVAKGYRYRLITVVQIWDGDKEIEKESCDSPIYDY